jgi:hypothetical protein
MLQILLFRRCVSCRDVDVLFYDSSLETTPDPAPPHPTPPHPTPPQVTVVISYMASLNHALRDCVLTSLPAIQFAIFVTDFLCRTAKRGQFEG